MLITDIFINTLSTSLAASFCLGMIFLMRKILDKKVEISKLSLLWIVFIITLVIPINFSSVISIKNYIKIPGLENVGEFVTYEMNTFQMDDTYMSSDSLIADNSKANMKESLLITTYSGYFIVVIILLLKDFKIYSDIKKINKSNKNERLEKILQIQKEKLHINKDIKIMIQDKIKLPSLYGIIDTQIIVSTNITQLSDEEIEMIFLHELVHYKKYHHVWYLTLKLLEDLHWFNPLIKIAGKFIREDFEYIVDQEVLNRKYDRVKYSKTILKTIDFEQLNSADLLPGIYENKISLERRIKRMKDDIGSTRYSVILIALAVIIISTFTMVFATEKIDETLENINPENKISEVSKITYPLKEYKISNWYGEREHPVTGEKIFHRGIDLKTNQGEEIYAVMDGVVVFANFETERGNTIRVRHENGTSSTYAHGTEFLVKPGEEVRAGQAIMTVGSTGLATGPHLHFEMEDATGNLMNVNQFFEIQ